MRVLVTFAVEAEFAPWRSIRDFEHQAAEGVSLWKTNIAGSEIFVVLTGIGDDSSSVLELMMRVANVEKRFDVCISSGLAGALNAKCELSDIVVARLLKSEHVHADLDRNSLEMDKGLVDLAIELGAKSVGAFFTTNRVLTTSGEKARQAGTADVVEMESFDVIKEGYAWGASGVAIRAISDRSDESLPIDFNKTISNNHTVSIPRVFAAVVKNPWSLRRLIRFGKQSRDAAQALAQFLEVYLKTLAQFATEQSSMRVAVR
jgi:nucleoside phosphorylase